MSHRRPSPRPSNASRSEIGSTPANFLNGKTGDFTKIFGTGSTSAD
jgi:hypothetical protein